MVRLIEQPADQGEQAAGDKGFRQQPLAVDVVVVVQVVRPAGHVDHRQAGLGGAGMAGDGEAIEAGAEVDVGEQQAGRVSGEVIERDAVSGGGVDLEAGLAQ